MADVLLAPGRDRAVRRRHPWVLSGAVARVTGTPAPGETVRVLSAEGETLGFGHYSPRSNLRVRMVALGKEDPGEGWLAERVARAVARRAADPLLEGTDAVRLLNAEADGVPGAVADRYGDTVVVRIGAPGIAARRAALADALRAATDAPAGLERADASAARREGFEAPEGPLWGAPPERVTIREGPRRYAVDLARGQKTGFYLDQREARALVERLAAGRRRCVDLFAYTGGFAVAAARGGAEEVRAVDSSADALALAGENAEANGVAERVRLERGDAFRALRGAGPDFDLAVIDPPPLARRPSDVQRAARAYKDLWLHALRRAAPEALVLAFSCSHHVGPRLFGQIAFGAALDAGREAQVLRTLEAPSDHPVSIDHPEGRYLSGLLLRVT